MPTFKISSDKRGHAEKIGLRRIMRDADFSVIVNNGDGSFTIEAETVPDRLPGQIKVEQVEQISALDGLRDAVVAAVTVEDAAVEDSKPVVVDEQGRIV